MRYVHPLAACRSFSCCSRKLGDAMGRPSLDLGIHHVLNCNILTILDVSNGSAACLKNSSIILTSSVLHIESSNDVHGSERHRIGIVRLAVSPPLCQTLNRNVTKTPEARHDHPHAARSSLATRRPSRVHCETKVVCESDLSHRLYSATYSLAQPLSNWLELFIRRLDAPGQAALTGPALDPSPTLSPFGHGPRDRSQVPVSKAAASAGSFDSALAFGQASQLHDTFPPRLAAPSGLRSAR